MNCPYCGAELIYECAWWIGVRTNIVGHIYQCNNSEGFEDKESAEDYAQRCGYDTLDDYLSNEGLKEWNDVVCASSNNSVCGSFYTDTSGELNDGYPC